MKLLIKDTMILTADAARPVREHADIAVEGDKIKHICETGRVPAAFVPEKTIDGSKHITMPGLVNCHTHVGMTLYRNYGNDLSLHDWLFTKIFPAEAQMTPEEVYWGTMLGLAEMIKSGTTSIADMYIFMEKVAEASAVSGMRVNLSNTPLDAASGDVPKRHVIPGYFEDYYKQWNGAADGRLTACVCVHSVYLLANDEVEASVEIARKTGAGIHIHILETEYERDDVLKRFGTPTVELCERLGVFSVPVIAAHCVHLTDDDLAILKKYNVSAIHNPTSNLKLGSGIARVPEMLARGINVALGTDGASSNNNLDMFDEMNLAALIHKGYARDPMLISAEQALRMATANGAASLGHGHLYGKVEEGLKADMIMVNIDQPHFKPLNEPAAAIVYAARGSDVDNVIVDGNILMEKRVLSTIDEEKAGYMVEQASRRIIRAANG